MANKINKPLCATIYGNTGFGDCFLEPAKIVGGFQVTSSFEINESDLSDFQDFLITKIHAAIGTRIFPYHDWISVADNTEDVNITTTDYGAKYINRDGFYDFSFRYLKGGVMLHQEIAKNAGTNKYFLFYDDNGVLYGYKSGGKLKGIPIDIFYVKPWGLPTGADQASYLLRFIINPKYMNQGNLGYLKIGGNDDFNFNLFDIAGLQEVDLTIIDQSNNVATVKVTTRISGVDLYTSHKTNLLQPTAWRGFKSDGTPSTVTNVADNAADEAFDVTMNPADYQAENDGAEMTIQLATPATLKAAPISMEGFDDSDGVAFIVDSASS